MGGVETARLEEPDPDHINNVTCCEGEGPKDPRAKRRPGDACIAKDVAHAANQKARERQG